MPSESTVLLLCVSAGAMMATWRPTGASCAPTPLSVTKPTCQWCPFAADGGALTMFAADWTSPSPSLPLLELASGGRCGGNVSP